MHVEHLKSTMNQFDLIDIYNIVHSMIAEFTFLSVHQQSPR